jgi:hypothetical protein
MFLDCIKVPWDYEVEGYELGEAGRYLPDFWLPEGGFFLEIKPSGGLTVDSILKARALVDQTNRPCAILVGSPKTLTGIPSDFLSMLYLGHDGKATVTFADSNTEPPEPFALMFGVLSGGDGKSHPALPFDPRAWYWHQRRDESFLLWPIPAFEVTRSTLEEILKNLGGEDLLLWTLEHRSNPLATGDKSVVSEGLETAYLAAQQARFEFGESGAR